MIKRKDEYELVAFSGTSGGAVCAFLTWCALSKEANEEEALKKATDTLRSFWTVDNSAYWKASDPYSGLDVLANSSLGLQNLWRAVGEAASGIDLSPQLNPYDWQWQSWAEYWRDRLRAAIEKYIKEIDPQIKKENIDQSIQELACSGQDLKLFIGAVNALTGEFWVFKSHKKKRGNPDEFVPNHENEDCISVDAVLASAAIPFVFEATRTGEAVYWDPSHPHSERTCVDQGVYWDGLYSQNPPYATSLTQNPMRFGSYRSTLRRDAKSQRRQRT